MRFNKRLGVGLTKRIRTASEVREAEYSFDVKPCLFHVIFSVVPTIYILRHNFLAPTSLPVILLSGAFIGVGLATARLRLFEKDRKISSRWFSEYYASLFFALILTTILSIVKAEQVLICAAALFFVSSFFSSLTLLLFGGNARRKLQELNDPQLPPNAASTRAPSS